MTTDNGRREFLRAIGTRVLAEANDLKRTPEALARELGLDIDVVSSVIDGTAAEDVARSLLRSMAAHYPVALGDLLVEPDDTDEGVSVMSAAASAESSRIFQRADRSGALTPYYEYRDTAMSRNAPFRPEWIKELRQVDDSQPDNPDVAYNKGHLLHQTTFFIGPVNFYWDIAGRRFSAEMETGDSNYITPLVPHSFTSRDPRRDAIIVAVTYWGQVRRAMTELQGLGAEALADLSGDLRQIDTVFRARLRRQLDAESMSGADLVDRLTKRGLEKKRAQSIVEEGPRSPEETRHLADALNLRPSDLLISGLEPAEEVVVRRGRDTGVRLYPDEARPAYRLRELARTKHQPYLKGFDLEVLDGGEGTLRHSLHEYVFNYGDAPVRIEWGDSRRAVIEPGGSAYVRPMLSHRFAREVAKAESRLVVIRVPGMLSDEVITELSAFEPTRRSRAAGESTRWF